MATTYELIAKTVLGSTSNTIDFQSIPADHDDLLILLSARTDYNTSGHYALGSYTFNNSGGTAYSWRSIIATTQALSQSNSGQSAAQDIFAGSSATSNCFSSASYYIPNYAGSANKSVSSDTVVETNSTTAHIIISYAQLWADTSAINRITFTAGAGNFVAGTSAYLYGITKA